MSQENHRGIVSLLTAAILLTVGCDPVPTAPGTPGTPRQGEPGFVEIEVVNQSRRGFDLFLDGPSFGQLRMGRIGAESRRTYRVSTVDISRGSLVRLRAEAGDRLIRSGEVSILACGMRFDLDRNGRQARESSERENCEY